MKAKITLFLFCLEITLFQNFKILATGQLDQPILRPAEIRCVYEATNDPKQDIILRRVGPNKQEASPAFVINPQTGTYDLEGTWRGQIHNARDVVLPRTLRIARDAIGNYSGTISGRQFTNEIELSFKAPNTVIIKWGENKIIADFQKSRQGNDLADNGNLITADKTTINVATTTKGSPIQPLPTDNKRLATEGGGEDLREFTVNGKIVTVNVTPVIDWLLKAASTTPGKRGEPPIKKRNYTDPKRPMNWWKVCTVHEILGSDSLIDHCIIIIDGGLPVRAYIKHLDPNIRNPFLPILELESQAAETQGLIDVDQTILDKLLNQIGVPPDPPPTARGFERQARENFQTWLAAVNRMNANNVKLYGWPLFDLSRNTTDYHGFSVSPHPSRREPAANSIEGRIKSQLEQIKFAQSVEFLATVTGTAEDVGGRKKNQVLDCGLRK